MLLTAASNPTSFGLDQFNELYITGFGPDRVYRFTPTVTSSENEFKVNEYSLEQNYPNPFNPVTVIKYNIPEESSVTIKIYDSIGKEIDTIASGVHQKGFYQKSWNAGKFSSGVYYVKINAKSLSSDKIFSNVIKMLYVK